MFDYFCTLIPLRLALGLCSMDLHVEQSPRPENSFVALSRLGGLGYFVYIDPYMFFGNTVTSPKLDTFQAKPIRYEWEAEIYPTHFES
jgi:hypothetical protein